MSLLVKFKKAHEDVKLPTRATEFAAGWDLYAYIHHAVTKVCIPPGDRVSIPTGLMMEIPEGYEAQVRPRSGRAIKEGLVACFGTIDSDYRGVVGVNLFNHSFHNVFVQHGERIGQMVFQSVLSVCIEEVSELSETERGANGFGSSGK